MEDIIYNELRMRGYNVDVGVLSKYIKDKNDKTQRIQLEVDFVYNKISERVYIQSAYSLPDREKLEQEQRSLTLTDDAFTKIIITGDDITSYQMENGIKVISLFDFLLKG
jgi:predicted AAA+ superfamily ATPase